ncbi:MAG: transporter [Thermoleophilia bacterium]|nr:transporter [Thermoleophilia bacterium]
MKRTARRERWREVAANLVREIRDGFDLSVRDGYLRGTLALTLFSGAANGLFFVSMVPWVTETLDQPTTIYGAIISLVGATGIIAAAVLARIGDRFAPERLALVGIGLTVLGSLAFFGTTDLRLIGVCLACFGVSNVVNGIGFSTIQQRRYPSDVQGRIGSLQMVATQAASLLAVALAGSLGATADPAMLVALFGAGLLLGEACALLALRSARRRPVAMLAVADPDLAMRLPRPSSLSASGSLRRRSSARARVRRP